MNRHFQTWHIPLYALSALLLIFAGPLRAEQIETSLSADGEIFFAVPLTAPASGETEPADIVIAVDLSAGQLSRQVRAEARKAVTALITGLPEGSRVRVFAVSNSMIPVSSTPGFIPVSPELAEAADADLEKETPLGAMDLKEMIHSAGDELRALGGGRPKSIVFIGRGVSTASFFDRHEAAALTDGLAKDRITFSAFANGAVTNNNALASLVFQTGGHLVDLRIKDGADAGRSLAESAKADVYWLCGDDLASQLGAPALYPVRRPPIRSDRETFLIGSGALTPGQELTLKLSAVKADGTETVLEEKLTVGEPKEENRALEKIAADAERDGGIALPIPGRALLREYQAALENQDEVMRKMGEQAAENGETEEAALLLNPGKTAAKSAESPEPGQASGAGR